MSPEQVIAYFAKQYPVSNIVALPPDNPTEIICEIDPSSEHPEYNVAIAAIKESAPHYHQKSTEVYEVVQGEIALVVDGQEHRLRAGDVYTIQPGSVHAARGNFAIVRVTSRPGWTPEDHFLVLK